MGIAGGMTGGMAGGSRGVAAGMLGKHETSSIGGKRWIGLDELGPDSLPASLSVSKPTLAQSQHKQLPTPDDQASQSSAPTLPSFSLEYALGKASSPNNAAVTGDIPAQIDWLDLAADAASDAGTNASLADDELHRGFLVQLGETSSHNNRFSSGVHGRSALGAVYEVDARTHEEVVSDLVESGSSGVGVTKPDVQRVLNAVSRLPLAFDTPELSTAAVTWDDIHTTLESHTESQDPQRDKQEFVASATDSSVYNDASMKPEEYEHEYGNVREGEVAVEGEAAEAGATGYVWDESTQVRCLFNLSSPTH